MKYHNKKIVYIFIILFILIINLNTIEYKKNNTIKPYVRIIGDFWINPYNYDFIQNMHGYSLNGSFFIGARLNNFTIGGEIMEHYSCLVESGTRINIYGAWNIIRWIASGYYEPLNWFEFKFGLGGNFFSSSFTNVEIGTIGIKGGGLSLLFDAGFVPWKYLQIKAINRFDVIFTDNNTKPLYYSGIRCNFHPYITWFNLYLELGLQTWVSNDKITKVNTGILFWGTGISIDFTPQNLNKTKKSTY